MKRIVFAALLLALSGCQTTGTNGEVSEAQSQAAKLCKFVPTAKTILAILELGVPHLSKATQIAEAICAEVGEVTDDTGGGGANFGAIERVSIEGKFVQ